MTEKIPVHIALIPDGNRRWAKLHKLEASEGHKRAGSYEHIKGLFDCARKEGVKYISFWGFSTDNWKRDKKETEVIFELLLKVVKEWRKEAIENKIRFRHFGRKDRLPKNLIDEIEKLEDETKKFDSFNVNLCLDYGGRDEIVRVMNKILKSGKKEINENDFAEYLDSAGIPEPDLIIRTSGENRTSGFMPFQAAYAELYFADVHFPDFDAGELKKAISEFGKRKRRFGGN